MANISLETEQRSPLQWLRRPVGEEYIIHTEEDYIRYFRALIKIEGIIYSENKKRKIWRDIKSACVILIIYALPLLILVAMICAKEYFVSLCSIPLFLFASAFAIAIWKDRKYKPFTIFDYINAMSLDVQKPIDYVANTVLHTYNNNGKKFPITRQLGYYYGRRCEPVVFHRCDSHYSDEYKEIGVLYQMLADIKCRNYEFADKLWIENATGNNCLELLAYKVAERYDNEWELKDYEMGTIPRQIKASSKLEFIGGGAYPKGGFLYQRLTKKERDKKIENAISWCAIGTAISAGILCGLGILLQW